MKTIKTVALALSAFLAPAMVGAGDIGDTGSLLCSSIEAVECNYGGGCYKGLAEEIGTPQFVRVNFDEKMLSARNEDGSIRKAELKRLEHIDGKLILQGAQDGLEDVRDGVGWSMTIDKQTGKMVFSASGDEVGFIIFGACASL